MKKPLFALIGLFSIAGSCSDNGVKVYHEPPVVVIVEPADGSEIYEGANVTFRAQVTTTDGSVIEGISHSWVANSTTICESAEVPADGLISCTASFDDTGDVAVSVSALDSRGDRGVASINVTVVPNEAPTVTLITPQDGDVVQSNDLVIFQATIGDAEDNAEDLTVAITSSQDGPLAVPTIGASSGAYSGSAYLSGGAHLLTITVTDTAGRTGQDTATVRVNDVPEPPTVSISPVLPVSDESLAAVILTPGVDPEGDTVTYRYDWHLNGDPTPYSSGSNPNLPRGIVQRDEYWEVRVYPYDGSGYGNPGTSSVVIGNAPPSIDSVTFNPTAPTTTDRVEAVPQGFYDPEGDTEQYVYVWYHNDTLDPAETTPYFPFSKTEKGDTLRVELTPYDDFEDGDTVSSPTITVVNTPPTQPGVSISPTAPQPENNLICTVGTPSFDADGDSVTYYYEWWKNGLITSQTTYVVDASYTAHGDVWECRVYPDDGEDTGTYGSQLVTVADVSAPANPTITSVDRYTNDEDIDLNGTCEAGCSLTFYLSDSTGSWAESNTCTSGSTYTHTTYVTRGYDTSIYATCTDSAGNTSGNSNTVTTQACNPEDVYEVYGGNTGATAVNQWSSLNDSGTTTITIQGNILNSTDQDWYLVSAPDNYSADVAAGLNAYNFQVNLTAGSGVYNFLVYADSYDSTAMICNNYSSSGYSEFDYYQQDSGDGGHSVPSDSRYCSSSGVSTRNVCTDMTHTWYIKVLRNSGAAASCQHYELTITNGLTP